MAALAQVQVNNRESQADSTGGMEVVETDLKTFLSHKKSFLKPHQEFNFNSSVWSATFRITCSLRPLELFHQIL